MDSLEARRRLQRLLAEKSYQRRRVTLASGRVSDFYFDSKQTVLGGEGAHLTGLAFFEAIRLLPEFDRVTAVGGMELGSVPIGTAISVVSHQAGHPLANLVIRKQAKGHGTQAGIEGASVVEPGATVVGVEDVVTTGGSSIRAMDRFRDAGYDVGTLITLIDRQEGGREAVEAAGYTLVSLFTRSDFEG